MAKIDFWTTEEEDIILEDLKKNLQEKTNAGVIRRILRFKFVVGDIIEK